MLNIDLTDLTCHEILKLAESSNIEVKIRTIYNWASAGKFGDAVGYHRQGRTYDRKAVESYLYELLHPL